MKRKQVQVLALLLVITMQASCSSAIATPIVAPSTATSTSLPSTPTSTLTPSITPSPTVYPTRTATPPPSWVTNFAEPILAAIKDHEPSFQDDFSTSFGKGWYIGFSGNPKHGLTIEDGILVIRQNDNHECDTVSNIAMTHPNFVLQVEIPGRSNRGDIDFHGFMGGGPRFFFSVNGSGTIQWGLGSRNISGKQQFGELKKTDLIGSVVQAIIVKKGTRAVLYLNEVPLAHIEDPDLDTPIHGVMFNCGRYDNVKFWNLDRIPNLP